MSKQALEAAALRAEQDKARRKQQKAEFAIRQKQLADAAAADKSRSSDLRKEELIVIDQRVALKKKADIEKEKDIVTQTRKDVAEKRAEVEAWEAKEAILKQQQREFYTMEEERWKKGGTEAMQKDEKKKAESEAEAAALQATMKAAKEAKDKAAKLFAKKSKAEMALETKKQAEAAAKKTAEREKAASQQRNANIEYARTHSDRLHWEPPPSPIHIATLAKEIRNRTESPTGK